MVISRVFLLQKAGNFKSNKFFFASAIYQTTSIPRLHKPYWGMLALSRLSRTSLHSVQTATTTSGQYYPVWLSHPVSKRLLGPFTLTGAPLHLLQNIQFQDVSHTVHDDLTQIRIVPSSEPVIHLLNTAFQRTFRQVKNS